MIDLKALGTLTGRTDGLVYNLLVQVIDNWGAFDHASQLSFATILLAHDPLSSVAYPVMTYSHTAAGNLPIITLHAWLLSDGQ